MENRIRILSIATIVAILAFLGMQVYWLYGRYEFSLGEYERQAYSVIVDAATRYNSDRYNQQNDSTQNGVTLQSSYNIDTSTDSLGRTRINATIISSSYRAHELLGITENRPLTKEEKLRASHIVLENAAMAETRKMSLDASGAPSEAAVWSAFKNFDAESYCPLTVDKMDSLLAAKGLDTDVALIVTDTLVWKPDILRHSSAFEPNVFVNVPYSELERKSVSVVCHLPVTDIFRGMASSLAIVALLSFFLIICLVFQFATILKLTRLDNLRNSFVTTMIHELKRPISTLKMCVSGIENERMMADLATKHELVAETRTALDNLSAYFSKLRDLTFNRVEQIPLNIQSLNLRSLFDAVARGAAIPSGKKVIFRNDIDGSVEVSADKAHLHNVVNNLIENAVKYSDDEVVITASASQTASGIELRITDSGNGISPTDLKHIFKRFYRGKASVGEQPGMGLGLAYVKLLIDAHGGEISVESTEGKGSCFTIRLPQ